MLEKNGIASLTNPSEETAVNYTIGEFMAENDLDWCHLTLDDRSLRDRFIQHTDRLMHAGFPSVL